MPIYIATHKQVAIDVPSGYEMIQVGAALKEHFCHFTDDEGDNISVKNPNYCELTALYYIWKNIIPDDNIVGLVHYRRFFYNDPISVKGKHILKNGSIDLILKDADIILPKPLIFKNSVWEQYSHLHSESDLKTCRKIISKNSSEYVEAFDRVMKRHSLYAYNMFITRYERFSKYMNWLFSVLFEVEKEIDFNNYNNYNSRVFGFLAERLLNVWVEKEQLSIAEKYVINNENSFSERTISYVKNELKKVIYK